MKCILRLGHKYKLTDTSWYLVALALASILNTMVYPLLPNSSPDPSSNSEVAYFLVTHGSSSPRSWRSLRKIVRVAQSRSTTLVDGGCLEGLDSSLAEQLSEFGDRAIDMGYSQILVVPIFLLPGVHVKEDLPASVAIVQSYFNDHTKHKLQFKLTDHLGNHPQIPHLLAQQFLESHSDRPSIDDLNFDEYPDRSKSSLGGAEPSREQLSRLNDAAASASSKSSLQVIPKSGSRADQNLASKPAQKTAHKSARIIIAHGSKRSGANQPIEELARSLHGIAAYWSVAPDLETQFTHLVGQGVDVIDVLPYFLSAGGITEIIGNRLNQLASDYQIQINFLPVPFTTETIADLAFAIATLATINPDPHHQANFPATANIC
jgi:sirohydrochlorin cobaltochelatase